MKRIYTLITVLCAALACQAQLPTEGDWKMRLGTIDQAKAKKMFEYVFAATSPLMGANAGKPIDLEFYINFKQLTTLAPYSDFLFYSGQLYEVNLKDPSMYKRMLDSIADPAIKMMLVEDVVEHGNVYVDNLDSVNVLREFNSGTKGKPLTMPLAKIKRAHYNYMYAHDPKYYPSHLYDKEKAYKLYKEAFKEFLAAKDEQGGDELEGRFVLEYFKTCLDLYKTDKEKYYEQFLGDYQEIKQVCDKLLIPYYSIPDSIKNDTGNGDYRLFQDYNYVTNAAIRANPGIIKEDGIVELFRQSGAADAARLKAYYAPRLEANRQNAEFLNAAISFMYANGFVNDSLFYYYCKASHDLKPTYENCIGLASSAHLGLVDKSEMRFYYLDALDLSSDEAVKAKIRFWIARSLYVARPKDENNNTYGVTTPEYLRWENDINACNTNLRMMLESSDLLLNDPSTEVRDYVAQAYYMLGENHFVVAGVRISLDDANASIDYFNKAQQANFPNKPINGRPTNLETRLGPVKEKGTAAYTRAQVLARQKAARENAAHRKAYEEYMRKKKAEEIFWNGGK